MHYFLTGHTGFKGAWLTLWLKSEGHSVSGLGLDPEVESLFLLANVAEFLQDDHRVDIRDAEGVAAALHKSQPDAVIHLAAQPLVQRSYREPRLTWETNVFGTLNLLEATDTLSSLQARLLVTTDKVYRNDGRSDGYVEGDPLGGDDPYSSSKAMMELLAHSWSKNFNHIPTCVARAGNVIGGGDVSTHRLFPDLMRSFVAKRPALIRSPYAVRPWQHVLDCLSGYVTLVNRLLAEPSTCGSWNFGPDPTSFSTVETVSDMARQAWGGSAEVQVDTRAHHPEAAILTLDSSKARNTLGWRDRLTLQQAITWTVEWSRAVAAGGSPREISLEQLQRYKDLEGLTGAG